MLFRVGSAYRVTDDVDHVAAPDDPLALVVAAQGTLLGGAASSWLVDDVKVDIIEVGSTPAADIRPDAWPDDLESRVFAVSHQWALDSATAMRVEVWAEGSGTVVATEVPVASVPALVAMKLQSAPRRAAASRHKTGSDYADAFRLLSSSDRTHGLESTMRTLRAAPAGLGDWAVAELARVFDREAERTVRAIAAATNLPIDQRIRPMDLRRIAEAALD